MNGVDGGARPWIVAAIVGAIATAAYAAPAVKVHYDRSQSPMGMVAESRLMQGRVGQATEIATSCLKDHPDDLGCKSVLSRARAQGGQCDLALPLFGDLRGSRQWTERTAMLEALCHVRRGDFSKAEAVFDEALLIRPNNMTPRFHRVMLHLREREPVSLTEDLQAFGDGKHQSWMPRILEGWRAVMLDEADADGRVAMLYADPIVQRSPQAKVQLAMMDCQRWLDVGEPFKADEAAMLGVAAAQGQPRLVSCRSEAVRRAGDPFDAWGMCNRPWHANTDSEALDGVTVRALADMGRLDEAAERLAGMNPASLEQLVSAWYLARARGDAQTRTAIEQQWAARFGSLVLLERHIPITEEG